MKQVILFKTHLWNSEIENFAIKLQNECLANDFFILLHDENNILIQKVSNHILKTKILIFTEFDIKNIYSKGFISMRLSNHWIMMWFYKKFNNYDYYWSVEYDVRINGNSILLWNYDEKYDFLYPKGNYKRINHPNINYYSGSKLTINDRYFGYLQLARYSNNAITYLDKCYSEGENGQDELITFSLLNNSNLTMSRKFLSHLIRGTWTWINSYSNQNKITWYQYKKYKPNELCIFHPIK